MQNADVTINKEAGYIATNDIVVISPLKNQNVVVW
jgi:hypothetical protein